MKTNDITKVTITKEDIILLIGLHLRDNGLAPIEEIKINIGEKDISEWGEYAHYQKFIDETIIECKKI